MTFVTVRLYGLRNQYAYYVFIESADGNPTKDIESTLNKYKFISRKYIL